AKLSLESVGHSVELASDGEVAVQMMSERDYDLVFMDMHMPGLNGIDAAKLHSFEVEDPIPIVILTADATDMARTEAQEADIAAFLTKPIKPEELRQNVLRYARNVGGNGVVVPIKNTDLHGASHTEAQRIEQNSISTNELVELRRCGASDMDLAELVQIFENDSYACIEEAIEAINNNQISLAQEKLHALKGGAATIGAKRIWDNADRLEFSSFEQSADLELLRQLPNLLEEAVAQLRAELDLNAATEQLVLNANNLNSNPSPL
ncbi:MAG: response regulator, partial [Pseudomonadota bacterium]